MSWPSAWWKYSMSSPIGWPSTSVAENQVTGCFGLAGSSRFSSLLDLGHSTPFLCPSVQVGSFREGLLLPLPDALLKCSF